MMTMFHADDYGITVEQAHAILCLSDVCGGHGALNSVSAFANSPVFEDAAALARPFVEQKVLHVGVHINLVEGRPCSDPHDVPLLLGPHGTFRNDFSALSLASVGPRRSILRHQIECECVAQIKRFVAAFPHQRDVLRIDSHQHIHMIPLVFDAVMAAAQACDCTVKHIRIPVEPLRPHGADLYSPPFPPPINLVKNAALGVLGWFDRAKLPSGCHTSLFCGIVFSGCMERADDRLISAMEDQARSTGTDLEVLFHPVSMQAACCLDPENGPFTAACCSPHRDAEAAALVKLSNRSTKASKD